MHGFSVAGWIGSSIVDIGSAVGNVLGDILFLNGDVEIEERLSALEDDAKAYGERMDRMCEASSEMTVRAATLNSGWDVLHNELDIVLAQLQEVVAHAEATLPPAPAPLPRIPTRRKRRYSI